MADIVLGEEVGVCWGDFFWKQSLLHRSMFVITSSWLCFLGVLSLFLLICLLFNFACHVSRLTYCVLAFDGPVHLASRSGVGVKLQSLFDLIWFSLVYRG